MSGAAPAFSTSVFGRYCSRSEPATTGSATSAGHGRERPAELIVRFAQLLGAASDGNDVGARVPESDGDGATEAAAGSCYQCGCVSKFLRCHG
jgi:hypothetical protein